MGISGGTKTKTKTQETGTTTPTTPSYVTPALTDYYGQVANIGESIASDPTQYVAQANDTLTGAASAANNLGGWQSGLDQSTSLATSAGNTDLGSINAITLGDAPTATAASILDTPIESYLNPVTQQLVDTTLASYDDQAGRSQAALQAQAAKAGAFGGSRYGIAQAQNLADSDRNRALTESELRSSAYDRATSLAQSDTANRQEASLYNTGLNADFSKTNNATLNQTQQFNKDLEAQEIQNKLAAAGLVSTNASSAGSLAQGDAAAQLAAGQALQQIDQATAEAPLTTLSAYNDLIDPALISAISGQTVNTSGTSTSTQSGGLLQSLLGAGAQLGGAAIMASDERVKKDVKRVDTMDDGLGLFSYRYKWDDEDDPKRKGVMAQDVARKRPWALGPEVGGVKTVNYGRL